ncbi:nascent polypeptide-associated complex subunit alpha, muscle-specific form-like [Frankliniella occidentalis]|uniref:Nascent polypeptide-associated complex subunit alpha, muscle-specific form-like n=1 Tax=Frankliniella occidentalis TaxID=133901 RepID=A0A6J1SQG1_FRAOC|nr:nascent polypeptide-associated complex subunit alpha, muscle-specific form-like [Frankliniella occidentalis]
MMEQEHVDKVKYYLTAYRCMLCMRRFGLAKELLEHNKLEHAELEDEVSQPEIITLDSDCEVESIHGAEDVAGFVESAAPSQLVPVPSVVEPQPPVVSAPAFSERLRTLPPAPSTTAPSELVSTLPPVVSAPALTEMISPLPYVSDISPRPFLAGPPKIRLGPLTWPAGPQLGLQQPCRFRPSNGPVGPSFQQPNVSFILMRPRQPEPVPLVRGPSPFAPAGLVGHAPNPGAAVSAAPVPTLNSASPPLEPAATPPSPASLGPAVAASGAKNNPDPVCRAEVTSTTLNEVIAPTIKSRTPDSRRASLILARKRSSTSTRPCQKPALPRRQKTSKTRAAPMLARPHPKPRVGSAPNSNTRKYVSILKPISKPASPDSPQVELETGEIYDITSTSEENLALTHRMAAPEPSKSGTAPVHLVPSGDDTTTHPSGRATPEGPPQLQDGATAILPAPPGDDTTKHPSDSAAPEVPPQPEDGAVALAAPPGDDTTSHPSDHAAPEGPPKLQDGASAVRAALSGDGTTSPPSDRAAPEVPPQPQDGATAGDEDTPARPSRRTCKRSARPGPASRKRPRTAANASPPLGETPLEQPPTQLVVQDEHPLAQLTVKEEQPVAHPAVKEQEDNALVTPVASEELQGEGAVTPRHSLRPRSRAASSSKQQLRSATSETSRCSITPPPLEPSEHRELMEALVPLNLIGFLEEHLDFPVALGAQDGELVAGEAGSSELPPVRQLRLARPRPASRQQTGAVAAPSTPEPPRPLLVPKLEDPSCAPGPRRGRPPSAATKRSAPARQRAGPASKKTRVVHARTPTGSGSKSSTATAAVKRKTPSRRPVISLPQSGQQPWLERTIQDHTRKVEGSSLRACNFCNFNARYTQTLVFHVLSHIKRHPNKTCFVCGAIFKTISLLKVHRTVVHNTAIYQCANCDHGRFETKHALRRHIELVQCFNKSV